MYNYWLNRKLKIKEKLGDKVLTFINVHSFPVMSVYLKDKYSPNEIMMKIAEGYAPQN